jgi:hypothetical protein
LRILFISEHLIIKSHTGEVIQGLRQNSEYLGLIDYKSQYLRLGKNNFEEGIAVSVVEDKIDLVILNLGSARVIDPEFLARLSNSFSAKVVILFPDPEHMFESHDRFYAQASDVCWVSNTGAGALFKLYGFKVYEKFGLSENYRHYSSVQKKYDVSFVGSIKRGDREDYLSSLASENIKLYVGGYQTEIGELSAAEKDLIIQQSWIHINFSKVENKELKIFRKVRQYKGRIHESCMLGTLPLTEFYSGIENHFPNHFREISFSSKEEMHEKIKFFLENKEITIKLANELKNYALKNFEINTVVRELFMVVKNTKFSKKELFIDDIFHRSFLSQRFYYLGRFLSMMHFKKMYYELCYLLKNYKSINFKDAIFQVSRGIYHSIKY